jgi:hypothetical protein
MSAFSTLNPNSSQLYMLPLSNLSSMSTDSLSTIFNQNYKDRSVGIITSNNSIYSCSGDVYRQCRRVRNTAIAAQQKQNADISSADHSISMRQVTNENARPRLSRFWNKVRQLQIGFHHRDQTGQYVQQINSPDTNEERRTTTGALETIGEHENMYHRASIEVAEPVYNELTTTVPVIPPPAFISVTSNDQDDEQDTTPVTGQTLCKTFFDIYVI